MSTHVQSRQKTAAPRSAGVSKSADLEEFQGIDISDEEASDYSSSGSDSESTSESLHGSSSTKREATDSPRVTQSKDKSSLNQGRRQNNASHFKSRDRGVMYVGRIPHGFYEEQMREYFSQFGEVTRLRLSRNKKTGQSKHYAFVEFASKDVAEIACETMHNYLLMDRLLQCRMLREEEIHPELWVGANRTWRKVPAHRVNAIKFNTDRTERQERRAKRNRQRGRAQQAEQLAAAGISYELPSSTKPSED